MLKIVISQKSETPIYEQLYQQLSSQIMRGELNADFCLPSIRLVAKELGISVITVKKAWELLEAKGFIYTQGGKGCFVASLPTTMLEEKLIVTAKEQFSKEVDFYKGLGLTLEEFITIVKEIYNDK